VDERTFGRRFEGKVGVVTGASTNPGIGRSAARRLGLEGASVVINARSEERLRDTERALRAEGIAVVAVPGAADDDEVPRRLVDAALEHFGRIDLLVNTVGGATYQGSALAIDRASLLDTLALNTWPTLALIQEAVGRGLADGGGAIVNVSSGSPKKTTPSMAAYAAGKAALNALTRTLANDLGPRGIRVNAVSPGLTMTSATRTMWDADGGSAAGERLLLGRLTEADDIGAEIAFLLADEARSITGVLLDVDAGNHVSSGSWSPMGSTGDKIASMGGTR
jgi:NAD(P)-dependent dehydrogenase (short-subunit alcohol dehydrogenase family)